MAAIPQRSPATPRRLAERLARGLAPCAVLAVLVHIVLGALLVGVGFPLMRMPGRNAGTRLWSRMLLLVLGVRVEVLPHPDAPDAERLRGALLVSNHISWLDVFAVASFIPVRFVAKSEVARWPVLGTIASLAGTIYVERGRRHAIANVNHEVSTRLRAGHCIGVFPEGTTTDGSCILRFHANLLQPALDAGATIVPLAVQYLQDGEPSRAAAFIGDMNLAESIWRIIVAPRLVVRLHWMPVVAIAPDDTRQSVTSRVRYRIAEVLGLPEAQAEANLIAARHAAADHETVSAAPAAAASVASAPGSGQVAPTS